MSFPEVQIGELASPESGAFKIGPFGSSLKKEELVKSGIPVVGIENVLGRNFSPPFRRFITDKKYNDLAQYSVKAGDVLVTTMGTIGRAAVAPANIGTMIIDSHLFRMRLNREKVYPEYLCYGLNGYYGLLQQLEQMSRGAIMDGLNTTILKECTIPLPPLPEQRRIAAILARAERLRRLRRTALHLSENYLQSVFVQMFGDPVTNPMGWDAEELGMKISFLTSGSRGWAKYYAEQGDVFLRIQNIGQGNLLLDDLAHVNAPATAEGRRTRVQPGDLLLSITADLGRTAVIPHGFPTAYINQHLALLRLKDIEPIFVSGYVASPGGQLQIDRLDREGVKSGLNFDDIRGFRIFVPPLPLQQRFAAVAARYERLRTQQREALRQAEHLFDTLLHRAFRGELGPADARAVTAELASAPAAAPAEVSADLVQMGLGLE